MSDRGDRYHKECVKLPQPANKMLGQHLTRSNSVCTYSDTDNPYKGRSSILDNNGTKKRPKSSNQLENAQPKLYLSPVDHPILSVWVHWGPFGLATGDITILQRTISSVCMSYTRYRRHLQSPDAD